MRARYALHTRLTGYLLLLLAVIASFFLLFYVYIIKFTFPVPEYGGVSFDAAIITGQRVFSDGELLVETDVYTFNGLANSYLGTLGALPDGVSVENLYFNLNETDAKSGIMYINVRAYETVFSFQCDYRLTLAGGFASAAFDNPGLGTLNLKYPGRTLWRLLGLPESVTVPLNKRGLMYLSDVRAESGGAVTLVYDYDDTLLTGALGRVLTESDERKIEFHLGKNDVDKSLIELAKKKAVTPAEAKELVIRFEKNPETFLSLCYLLNEEGIYQLYILFGDDYYKHVSADKLAEASENEINSDINAFSKRFSKLLLQYLYRNPDYEIYDGTLYVRGEPVTPEILLSGSGEPDIYDIEISADETGITVTYGISGYETEKKVIFAE